MAQGTRSMNALSSRFSLGNDPADTSDYSDQVGQRLSFLESYYNNHSKGDHHLQQSSRFTDDDSPAYHTDS